jgi:hypothetical protein
MSHFQLGLGVYYIHPRSARYTLRVIVCHSRPDLTSHSIFCCEHQSRCCRAWSRGHLRGPSVHAMLVPLILGSTAIYLHSSLVWRSSDRLRGIARALKLNCHCCIPLCLVCHCGLSLPCGWRLFHVTVKCIFNVVLFFIPRGNVCS